MSASVVETFELERMIERAIDDLEPTKEDMQIVGDVILERILDRLSQGLGADGQPLAPYAASTRRQRAKRGREVDLVTLMDTGRMVSFIVAVPAKKHATIYVSSSTEREKLKRIEAGTRHMPPRVILAENADDMEIVADLLIARLSARIG